MTAQTKSTLKGNFETGDAPDGTNYADLIDSFLGLIEASAQTVTGPVSFTGAVALTNASAQTFTGDEVTVSSLSVTKMDFTDISGQAATVSSLAVLSTIDANSVSAQSITGSAVSVLGTMSAATVHAAGNLVINTAASANSGVISSALANTGSAARFVTVTVSGTDYWLALFAK